MCTIDERWNSFTLPGNPLFITGQHGLSASTRKRWLRTAYLNRSVSLRGVASRHLLDSAGRAISGGAPPIAHGPRIRRLGVLLGRSRVVLARGDISGRGGGSIDGGRCHWSVRVLLRVVRGRGVLLLGVLLLGGRLPLAGGVRVGRVLALLGSLHGAVARFVLLLARLLPPLLGLVLVRGLVLRQAGRETRPPSVRYTSTRPHSDLSAETR